MAGVLQKLLSIVGVRNNISWSIFLPGNVSNANGDGQVHSLGDNLRDGIAKLIEAAQKLLGG